MVDLEIQKLDFDHYNPEEVLLNKKFFKLKPNIKNIFISGMGACGVLGDLIRDYLQNEIKIPIIVNKSQDVPKFVNSSTLAIILSYSGKTKETLMAAKKCKKQKAQCIAITSRDSLKKTIKNSLILPPHLHSRSILYFGLPVLLNTFYKAKLISDKTSELKECIKVIENFNSELPKKHLRQMDNKIPIIYSTNKYKVASYYWKTQLNELSKIKAINNNFPELIHNEIESKNINSYNFLLYENNIDPLVKSQIEKTKRLLKPNIIKSNYKSDLAKIFYFLYFADHLACYIAKKNKINPIQTPVIDKIKSI